MKTTRRGRVENLVPQNMRSKEEQREIARMGGLAAGAKRRKLKSWKEAVLAILNDERFSTDKKLMPYDEIVIGMLNSARMGDSRAAVWIRDTAGGMPVREVKQESSGEVTVRWATAPEAKKEKADE